MIERIIKEANAFNQKVYRNEATPLEMLGVVAIGMIGKIVWDLLTWLMTGC